MGSAERALYVVLAMRGSPYRVSLWGSQARTMHTLTLDPEQQKMAPAKATSCPECLNCLDRRGLGASASKGWGGPGDRHPGDGHTVLPAFWVVRSSLSCFTCGPLPLGHSWGTLSVTQSWVEGQVHVLRPWQSRVTQPQSQGPWHSEVTVTKPPEGQGGALAAACHLGSQKLLWPEVPGDC